MITSIIESKNYIPWVVRQSRDIQSFTKLLDLIINNVKTNIDYWVNLIDFSGCPDHLLPLLASYVGYEYDYTESYTTNRLIIKYYPYMIRNRGSEVGISLATALSVNALGEVDKVEALNMFRIEYTQTSDRIKIYIFFPSNLNKMHDLLEVVRPAGCTIELVPASSIQTIDGMEIHSYEQGTKYPYDITRYSVDAGSRVGFTEITNQNRD